MKVKIDFKNGMYSIHEITEERLDDLISKIGTKEGKKAWVGKGDDNKFIVAIVPNEIVTINNCKGLKEKF